MTLLERLLDGAPAHEPEFEAWIYDFLGRLVAILPMEKTAGVHYRSEVYAGPALFGIVALVRDGADSQILFRGFEIKPGYSVGADIPEPNVRIWKP